MIKEALKLYDVKYLGKDEADNDEFQVTFRYWHPIMWFYMFLSLFDMQWHISIESPEITED